MEGHVLIDYIKMRENHQDEMDFFLSHLNMSISINEREEDIPYKLIAMLMAFGISKSISKELNADKI